MDVLAANYGVWKLQEAYDAWAYAVTDLDQNGRLELISTEMHGTGHYTTTAIWEINPSLTGLILCGRDRSCDLDILDRLAAEGGPQSCGLIISLMYSSDGPMAYPVYYDADADLYRYVVQDTVTPKSDWYEMTVQHSFALRNSRISGRLLTYEADNFSIGQQGFWDQGGNFISEEAYQTLVEAPYPDLPPMQASILWISDQHLGEFTEAERYALLKNSMESFQIQAAAADIESHH